MILTLSLAIPLACMSVLAVGSCLLLHRCCRALQAARIEAAVYRSAYERLVDRYASAAVGKLS